MENVGQTVASFLSMIVAEKVLGGLGKEQLWLEQTDGVKAILRAMDWTCISLNIY